MILSCMGNASQGELANSQNLTLNNLKKMKFKFEKIKGGKCTIPGFSPPNLPNFVIPSIPLFKGLPPFPTLCFLPPFPGIPALSLPAISIPLPPLPGIPPIPLPIPSFSLPFLPLLPSFDLGALSFLCGLFSISLPIIDPFAGLNKLLSKLNALIAALNNFLKFCQENAKVIADTQVPAENAPTILDPDLVSEALGFSLSQSLAGTTANPFGIIGGFLLTTPETPNLNVAGSGNATGLVNPAAPTASSGIKVAEPIEFGPAITVKDVGVGSAFAGTNTGQGSIGSSSSLNTSASIAGESIQAIPTLDAFLTAFGNIATTSDESVEQYAFYLANEGLLPADPTIINQVATLFASAIGGLAVDATPEQLYQVLVDENVPSAEGFIGFVGPTLEPLLESTSSVADFTNLLIANGLLSENKKVVSKVYEVLKDSDIGSPDVSGLEIAILLNSSGIPFGTAGKSVSQVSDVDVSRAFFIRSTTTPFTPEKIVKVLTFTGVLRNVGKNIDNAVAQLTPLPVSLTPTTISIALAGIIPGPGIDSLKAACIASTKGTTSVKAIAEIEEARRNALLRGLSGLTRTPFVQALAALTPTQFRHRLESASNISLSFPLSIWELIPLLSAEFDVDDLAVSELLNNFIVPSIFFNFDDLFGFLNSAARSVSSSSAAQSTLDFCKRLDESGFNYSKLVQTITNTLQKYSITLPTTAVTNKNIANALAQEFRYNYLRMLNVLGTTQFQSYDEITFALLATGALVVDANIANALEQQGISPQVEGSGTVGVSVRSPTGLISDIQQDSINIEIVTKKYSTSGVIITRYQVVQNGLATLGSTVVLQVDDISQTLKISIVRINGFVPTFEAVESVDVQIKFATVINATLILIPSNYINVVF